MKRSKYLSFLLAVAMLFTMIVFPLDANAVNYSGLNTSQKYFLRVLGSLSRADYYETDILASVTLSQGIFEGGWGAYSLPVGGNNIFGIKAYNNWSGKVYDQTTSLLYNTYDDFLLATHDKVSAWRAHDSWMESVRVHSDLLLTYDNVAGEPDARKAYEAIVAGGYCNDNGYIDNAMRIIDTYGLLEYDDITPDSDGIVAITANTERLRLDIGETYTLGYKTYPSGKKPSKITWKSGDPKVATVDKNGKITAVAHGMTLVSATLANGREACCIVYVDCNATVINSNVQVYKTASSSGATDGKIYRGMMVKVTSTSIRTDSSGNRFYAVTGYNNNGKLVSGFVNADCIYLNKRNVSKINAVRNDITLKVNDKYKVATSIASADAVDTTLSWTTDNASIANVDSKGVITAKKAGSCVVTATAVGGAKCTIKVNVASAYKEYTAYVDVSSTLRVRKSASWSAGTVGKFVSGAEIIVNGEAEGYWLKVTGVDSEGDIITGYVHSGYISFQKSSSGSSGSGDSNSGNSGTVGVPVGSYYGRVIASSLTLRASASSSANSLGTLNKDTDVIIVGDIIDGSDFDWYNVIVTASDGTQKKGYIASGTSSESYVAIMYEAKVVGIDDRLNVREAPNTSATVISKLYNNDTITVIGEKNGNWYNVEYIGSTGKAVNGYCSADYIEIVGRLCAETSGDFGIVDSSVSISGGVLTIKDKTTASKLLSCFTGAVSLVSSDGKTLNGSALVGTGAKLLLKEGSNTKTVATVIFMGDVDGDGEITANDYIVTKRVFFGTGKLSGVYLKAALISNNDVVVTSDDYILLKRVFFGTYKIQ